MQPGKLVKAGTEDAERLKTEREARSLDPRPTPIFLTNALRPLMGKRIVLQSQRGHCVYRGRLVAINGFMLRLEDCEIVGTKNAVRPPFVLINTGHMAHVHADCKVERRDDTAPEGAR
jgi:hypothetical protein